MLTRELKCKQNFVFHSLPNSVKNDWLRLFMQVQKIYIIKLWIYYYVFCNILILKNRCPRAEIPKPGSSGQRWPLIWPTMPYNWRGSHWSIDVPLKHRFISKWSFCFIIICFKNYIYFLSTNIQYTFINNKRKSTIILLYYY